MISIIIPVYKVETYLRECLESVLAQTFTDWEAICVDDGSPDGCGAILEEYAARDGRFKVIHQKNAGLGPARNSGLNIACGEWVTFLDSDDYILPNWLEEAMDLAQKGDFDLIRLRPGGREKGRGKCYVKVGREASVWCWNTLLNVGFVWICFYRRKCFNGTRFRNVCKEDGVFQLDMIPNLKAICQGEYAGYYYRPNEGSLTKSKRRVGQTVGYLNAYADIWRAEKDWAESLGIVDVVRRWLRQGADFEVWEWTQRRDPKEGNGSEIRKAYKRLESLGALGPGHELILARLRLPLQIWYWTGSLVGFRVLEWITKLVRVVRRRTCK